MMVIFVCVVRVITQPSTSCFMLGNCWYCLLWVVFMKLCFASCTIAPLAAIWALRKHCLLCSSRSGGPAWKLTCGCLCCWLPHLSACQGPHCPPYMPPLATRTTHHTVQWLQYGLYLWVTICCRVHWYHDCCLLCHQMCGSHPCPW